MKSRRIADELGHDIDVVLLDVAMPSMSGPEAFRELRGLDRQVPVVVTSGFTESETAVSFAGRDIAGFLPKPFTDVDLLEAMRTALLDG